MSQLSEGKNDPHIFKAIFLAGSPGSGKSTIASTMFTGTGLKILSSDTVLEHLARKNNQNLDPEMFSSDAGKQTRKRAQTLAKKQEDYFIDNRLGIVIDGTGKHEDKYFEIKRNLESLGYECSMIFVNCSLKMALKRNKNRARVLPDETVRDIWNTVTKNLSYYRSMFGNNFHLLNTDDEFVTSRKTFMSGQQFVRSFLNKPITNKIAQEWLAESLEETPAYLDQEDSESFRQSSRADIDTANERKDSEKIKYASTWKHGNLYYRQKMQGRGEFYYISPDDNTIQYRASINYMGQFLYQPTMAKRAEANIDLTEIFQGLIELSIHLGRRGVMSSDELTVGGVGFWKKFLHYAKQKGYSIGLFHLPAEDDDYATEFITLSDPDDVIERGSNSEDDHYAILNFANNPPRKMNESPVASDRDTSASMKDHYHGALETISADLKNQEPDISFDEFDFYYRVDTKAVHYSQNVFVMKNGDQPVYFATLREFMGYLYQFFMAKADGAVSISKERILMGLFKLSKKLNKKGIKTSDTLSYGGKHFWINIVKIALDKNYPVWINDREETFPIANSNQADEMFEKHNVFGDEGVDIYIGNSLKKSLTESIEGQGFDIYVHQFDGYKVQLNISSNDMSVKSPELEALVMDKRYDVYRTLDKENKQKLETQWKEVEQQHVNKLEQNLGSLTEDYLATANALIHLEIQDTVNSYNNLLNNFQGVNEEEAQLNEYIEDRETGVTVDVSQRRDGFSALVNISSNELTSESERLSSIYREFLFGLSRKAKEKGFDSTVIEQLNEETEMWFENIFKKGHKEELEKIIYELTVDYWSTARSILEIKTEQIGIEAEQKIEELKRKYGL